MGADPVGERSPRVPGRPYRSVSGRTRCCSPGADEVLDAVRDPDRSPDRDDARQARVEAPDRHAVHRVVELRAVRPEAVGVEVVVVDLTTGEAGEVLLLGGHVLGT